MKKWKSSVTSRAGVVSRGQTILLSLRRKRSGQQRYIVLFWPHQVINDAYLRNTIQITLYRFLSHKT